jgi:hypothetical protein
MNRDLYNTLSSAQSVKPAAAKTAAVTGSGVDLAGYDGCEIQIPVGVRTDSSFVIALKESADNVTYTAVASGDIIGTQPTISGISNTVYAFGYRGTKRYVRVDSTFVAGGASAGAFFGAIVVRGLKRHEPTH